MLQLSDKNKKKIAGLKDYKDLCIESTLESGDKTLSFLYPQNSIHFNLIEEEGYITTKENEYVIKEINPKPMAEVRAVLNLEDLEGKHIDRFESVEQPITACLNLILVNTGWRVGKCNVTKKRTVRSTNQSAYQLIQDTKKVYRVDIVFNTLTKMIDIYEELGEDRGAYIMEDLNLRSLEVQSNTYQFYTRVIAEGKEGLTFESINGGKNYVENHQYSDKVKTYYWKDERYTVKENLKEDAAALLEDLSKPYRSYGADIINLAKFNPKYKNILDFGLGDKLTLKSKSKKINEKQRITKLIEYPQDYTKDRVEIANARLTFEDIQKEFEDVADTVDNITTDNGTVDGSKVDGIDPSQIKNFKANVVEAVELNVIQGNFQTINAILGNFGELLATKISATELEAVEGRFQLAIINKADITDLNATNGKIDILESKTAQIDVIVGNVADIKDIINGNLTSGNIQTGGITGNSLNMATIFIQDGNIINLNADKINGGEINLNKVKVKSENGGIEIVGATQQFKDKSNRVRIQMGQDTQGNFNFILRGEDGTSTLIDHTGIKEKAIADNLIKENMIGENAVGEKAVDYNSFATGFNKDTNTAEIKATKVRLNNQNQSLEVGFTSLKTQTEGNTNTLNSHTTEIGMQQGKINTLIADTTIVKDGQTVKLKDAYNKTEQTVNSMKSTISEHETTLNEQTGSLQAVTIKTNELERNLGGMSSTLTETNKKVETQSQQITQVTTTAQKTKDKLDNLKVNTRNLLTKTNFDNGITGSDWKCNATLQGGHGDPFGGNKACYITVSQPNSYLLKERTGLFPRKGKYTLSVWLKGTKAGNFNIQLQDQVNKKICNLTTEWQRFELTGEISDIACQYEIVFGGWSSWTDLNMGVYIAFPMLVEGDIVADWTLAPEDIDSSINAVQGNLNTTNNNLNNTNNKLNQVEGTANNTKDKLNNLQIGTRNLALLSNNNGEGWRTEGYHLTNIPIPSLKPNTKYTIVLKATVPTGKKVGVWWNSGNAGGHVWERWEGSHVYTIAVNTPTTLTHKSIAVYNYPSSVAGELILEWLCVYEGDIKPPMDWTQAPEDIEQAIDTVKTTVTGIQTTVTETTSKVNEIKQEIGRINLGVEEINKTTTEHNVTIQQHTQQIASKPNQSDITNAKNEAITGARNIPDTRNDNQNPSWYIGTYPRQTITEFKYAHVVGIPNALKYTYGLLETKVPWNNSSGGYPVQTFRSNSTATYQREGTNSTTWSVWVQMEDTQGSQNKSENAKNEAINSANNTTETKLTVVRENIRTNSSSIETMKNQINLKVSQTDIDKTILNMQIGNENLIPYSNFAKSDTWIDQAYNTDGLTNNSVTYPTNHGQWSATNTPICLIRGSNKTSCEYGVVTRNTIKVNSNTQYTLSFLCSAHRIPRARIIIRNSGGGWIVANDFTPNHNSGNNSLSGWGERKVYTFNTGDNTEIKINITGVDFQNDGFLWLTNLKLEEGNKNTAWCPASYDLKDFTTTKITEAKAEIKVTTEQINLEVSKKVNSNAIVSTINQTAEAVKIKASKIELNGATSIGDSNSNHVKIENANYTIQANGVAKLRIGVGQYGTVSNVPSLSMGVYGINSNHHQFTMVCYGGGEQNPGGEGRAYTDMGYYSKTDNDWSNIKMFDGGVVRIAPVKELEITTNYTNGAYHGTWERPLAKFATKSSGSYEKFLQIQALVNTENYNGLVLADERSGQTETRIRVQTGRDGNRYFCDAYDSGSVRCGSSGYPWHSVTTRKGVSYGIVDNGGFRNFNIDGDISSVLDSMSFEMDIHRGLGRNTTDSKLQLDIGRLKHHPLAGIFLNRVTENVDGDGMKEYINADMTSLLHLALYEIQQLKNEIKDIKGEKQW